MGGSRVARVAAAAAFFLVAFACTGGAEPPHASSPTAPTDVTQPAIRPGGSAVFAAEGWSDCLNPIKTCAGDWAWYTVLEHVLPRAMELDVGGTYAPSVLLAEAPSLENGGLRRGPPFTVTFRIREDAVWEDGSPITSDDFAFTWKAILNTTNSSWIEEYRAIRDIDASDPKTVVIQFRDVTAGWPEFFGGSRGFLLKRAAFPRADPARPDLQLAMERDIPFSGGPWILESWDKDQAVLTRNDRYYGRKATFDHVVFVPRQDQTTEVASLLRGEVAAISSDPSGWSGSTSLLRRLLTARADSALSPEGRSPLRADTPVVAVGSNGIRFEALWFNPTIPPLHDPKVRRALMYAVDRQAIVDGLVKPNNPVAEVLNCGFLAVPGVGPWCATKPFERFHYDPTLTRRLLERAGYRCASSPCTRRGEPLEIRHITHATSVLQVEIQQLLRQQFDAAGIELKVVNYEAGVLFGEACPFAKIHVTQCARPAPPGGSVTDLLGCQAIPTKRTDYVGENRSAWCNQDADRLMRETDQELDPARRLEQLSRIHEIEADVFMGLPLFAMPVVSAWRMDKIAGPIGTYASSPYGLFFNMNEWHLP